MKSVEEKLTWWRHLFWWRWSC